jgi:beta-galactosidase GanA
MNLSLSVAALALASAATSLHAQTQIRPLPQSKVGQEHHGAANDAHRLPQLVQRDGRFALLVDGKPYLMLGAQVNNSSAWPEMLPKVWPTVEKVGINTLEVPIYWEQFEPERGRFDASILTTLLKQAREHHVHLVLLWFGTWKNGSGHYTPEYIKRDELAVPHVMNRDGHKVDSLSPHSEVALHQDRAAFAMLMRTLKSADPEHTVLMVQVENEAGSYGSVRDFSPQAQRLFDGPVPDALLTATKRSAGSWREVFGADADETFHAWSIAQFINSVATAGKAEYDLPMYVNVALRDPFHPGSAGSYESGGATDNMIPIWKAGAPSIDVIGPDLYNPDAKFYERVLDLYGRPDNAMFVPETGNAPAYARYFFTALGHGAIGFSPFGLDATGYVNFPLGALRIDDEALAPFALIDSIFAPMQAEIADLNFRGKLKAVSESQDMHSQTLDFGRWKADISYGLPQFGSGSAPPGNNPANGGAMVAQLGPDKFLVTGVHVRIDFTSATSTAASHRQFIKVEEGAYRNGAWHATRIWNGDQTDYGLNFTSAVQVLRVTLATY